MLTFAVDDLSKNFRDFVLLIKDNKKLTESPWLPRWLDYYSINYNTIQIEEATINSWYLVGVNFWDFDQDYLGFLSESVRNKLSNNSIRLLFTYREGDSPRRIRSHIEKLATLHGINDDLIWLISGNNTANTVKNCIFFWYFDYSYFFQTKNSPHAQINHDVRSHNITCLSRVHKQWREWFVYNLYESVPKNKNFLSYGNVIDHLTDDHEIWDDDSLHWAQNHIPLGAPTWQSSLPLRADSFSLEQHNQHEIVVLKHFQDSYWNIVLETLLSTEDDTGIFITEKTLKPIRNGQSFIVLGCYHTLAMLKENGYKTFNHVINETYDEIPSIHDRWYHVYELAHWLGNLEQKKLQSMQDKCVENILHNQKHFLRNRQENLMKLTAYLDTV